MKKILFLILFASGCSSQRITPMPVPSDERLSAITEGLSSEDESVKLLNLSEESARIYLLAMKAEESKDYKGACNGFTKLAKMRNFPLNQAALVHSLEDCTFSARELKSIWKEANIPEYLKEVYLDDSLLLAEKLSIKEGVANFSYELAAFKQIQSEKVKLLKNAIAIAQELGHSEDESKYFQKLTEVSPLYLKEVNKENIYKVAKDFEANRQFSIAQNLYLDIINGDFALEEKVKAYNSYRTSFKVSRNLKMFLEKTGEMELFLRQLLDENPDDLAIQTAWTDSKINYARAVWTEHMNAEARVILDEVLERDIGNQNQLASLYWIYGSLHIESKENDEALKKFEKAAQFKVSGQDQIETIQWAIVWNKYLMKKYSSLINDVDIFLKKTSNPNFIHKLNFWKAKSLLKLKRNEEGRELLLSTIENDNFGFYGLVSAMELQLPLSPLPASTIINEPSGNLTLDWLIAMNEQKFSVKQLKIINPQFKTIAQRQRAMSLYARTGWYQGGMTQIYNFPVEMRNELTKKYVSVVFPNPYQDLFSKHSRKYHIPLALPFAITRQESAFNPSIRSWADAFGLMQMIPEKAAELSKKYSIPYENFNDLYRPDPNIEMGSALLSELRNLFKGKFVQSVAAYNASVKVIAVWEKERFNGNYLEFIEMIPYEETRNYIKLVFRNYFTYKRAFSGEEIIIPEDFFTNEFN